MEVYSGSYTVYIHINKINNKMYVGITSINPRDRWKNGKAYHENTHFYSAIQKYGWDSFDHIIFASNLTQDEAFNMEKLLIDKFQLKNRQFGYNMIDGGSAPPRRLGQDHPNYGKPLSEEIKRKISISKKGRKIGPHSEETKEKIRQSHIGKHNPCSDTRKAKVSERMSGSNNPRAKRVLCVELNIEFPTAKDASLYIRKSPAAVRAAIHSNTKAGGYTWKYL